MNNIYRMAKEVEGEDIYLQSYFYCSEWTHSTISQLARAEETNAFNDPEIIGKDISNPAIAVAFQSLFQTTEFTNNLFDSKYSTPIKDLKEKYLDFHKKTTDIPLKNTD